MVSKLARRLAVRLLSVQALLLVAVTALACAISFWLPVSLPAWAFVVAVGITGIILALGAQASVAHLILPVTTAISEIENTVQQATQRMAPPRFTERTRRTLPEVTEAIDRAVNRIRSSYRAMAGAALTDPVTGLPNRKHFVELMAGSLPTENSKASCALLFLDLDQFKAVNDSLGHAMGDELLRAFARRVSGLLRQDGAVLARQAGDEFTILLPGPQGVAAADAVAERILTALKKPFRIAEHRLTIGASIGICRAPQDGGDFDTLMRNADTAMYRAKAAGRNQAQVFEPSMHEDARERLDIETCLRGAAQAEEFTLYLQPQVSCRTGEMIAAEALIRWNHPQRGLLMPGAFIDIAEQTGIIKQVGSWVFEEAIAMLPRLNEVGNTFKLSINVSMQQIESLRFLPYVDAVIARTGLDPSRIEVEITESLVMADDCDIAPKLRHLRALGMTIAVDDFGTGYSNLARLKTLPIDKVKIDRSLIADIGQSATSRTIVQAIISLVQGLGYVSVGEGVETDIQRDILTVMGCDIIQGYGIARPMEESAFIDWAKQAKAA